MDLEKYLGMNPEMYSDADLIKLRDSFLEIYETYEEEWAEELAEIMNNPKFDQYSFFGKRKLKKFNEKHADKMSTVEVLLEIIQEELDRRDNNGIYVFNKEENDYDSSSNVSEDEFIRKEREKTERIREIIRDDVDSE